MEQEKTALVPYLPHCAVMLVLDTSHSMYRGRALYDLHRSVRAFFDSLAGNACKDAAVKVSAVGMGDDLRVLDAFRPYAESNLPGMRIRPKGDTPIGGALRLALAELDAEERRMTALGARTAPSQLILLSDGVSTDDFHAEADEIARRVSEGRLVARAIALGPSADRATLSRLSCGSVLDPSGLDMAGAFATAGADVSRNYGRVAAENVRASFVSGDERYYRSHRFLVDGTNMLHWDAHGGLRLDYVLSLARTLKTKNADYRVFFDATTPHKLREKGRLGDEQTFAAMVSKCPDRFVVVPAGTEADAFILMMADKDPDSVVISQDLFRDRQARYPWIRDHGRRIAGMAIDGELLFPGIGLSVRL